MKGKSGTKVTKDKKQKQRDRAQKLLLEAHPENMRIAIAVAQGKARNVVCPHCRGKFDIKVGDNSNKEVLKELIQQIEGKPKQATEIDLKAKFELDNTQLLQLHRRFIEFQKEHSGETIGAIEAEFKEIKEPEIPAEASTIPEISEKVPDSTSEIKDNGINEGKGSQEITVVGSEQYGVKD